MTAISTAMPVETRSLVRASEIPIILFASLFIALSAQVAIPLPGTHVPACFQPQAVLLMAAVLGGRLGFLSVVAYLLEGMMGLPVFAMGSNGLSVILGGDGGYLLSYLLVAYGVGRIFESGAVRSSILAFAVMLMAGFVTLTLGTLWIKLQFGLSFTAAFGIGFAPFVGLDLLKVLMAAQALPLGKKLLGS